MAFPGLDVIKGVLPLIQDATSIIAAFRGDDPTSDGKLQQAISVLKELFPLIETFGRGEEVTQEDVRVALAEWDDKIADFDAAIARHGG